MTEGESSPGTGTPRKPDPTYASIPAEGTGSASSGSSSTTTSTTPFKPTKPKFGDLQEIESGVWTAWVGGEPLADWSGLKEPKPLSVTPTQFRANRIYDLAKSRKYRIEGMTNKFTRSSDMLTFQKKVTKHLKEHGMDTIAYLQDPTDSSKVVSVVDHHALFPTKEGAQKGKDQKDHSTKYDRYCHDNDRDAREFLINSLDEDLEKQIYENCSDEDSFITVWFNLINLVKSTSVTRFDKIKDKLKARRVENYKGEDIEAIASDYLSDWTELHGASMYDQNLTLTMLDEIMKSGGSANEDFRHPLRNYRSKLKAKLLDIRHMSYSDAHRAMTQDKLDVKSMLTFVKDEYRELYDNGKWPAMSHPKDNKGISKSYGSVVNMADDQHFKQLIYKLVQSANAGAKGSYKSNKGPGNCNICGSPDHWAKDCPKRNNKTPFKKPNSRFKSARNNPGRFNSRKSPPQERAPPPRMVRVTPSSSVTPRSSDALMLDLYVDADFCGLFGREDPRDPNSVKSRSGYIIILNGWPIIWKSFLQSHLSQSTLEAEYSALSSALRVFLPLKRLIEEMIAKTQIVPLKRATIHATVFEDNAATYFLATNQRITSRTKYLLAKWHHFWDAYNRKEFSIVKCPTTMQLADYMTKALPKIAFETNRKGVQDW